MNDDIITITGNLGADPTVTATADGATVARFTVASTHRRRDKDSGRWVDADTSWYRVSAFRSLGANAASSLRQGERVVVSGRLRLREWERRDGSGKGFAAEIDAESLGHDLRWGTTQFTRGGRRAEGSGDERSDEAWSEPADTSPATDAEPVTQWEAVPLGADAAGVAQGDTTPF